jgi:hypothetical protein
MNYNNEFEKLFDLSEYADNYIDTLHTVIVVDINEQIICFGFDSVFHINMKEKKVYKYDKQPSISADGYCDGGTGFIYCLGNTDTDSGLKAYDIVDIIKNKRCNPIWMK